MSTSSVSVATKCRNTRAILECAANSILVFTALIAVQGTVCEYMGFDARYCLRLTCAVLLFSAITWSVHFGKHGKVGRLLKKKEETAQ